MAWLGRQDIEDRELRTLAPFATKSRTAGQRRRPDPEDPLRTAFQRDRDRVIHSAAFRRLQHKTQVLAAHSGDHHRSRMTHSLEVSQMARAVARSLGLNGDLAEAVALAHDLGHPPFGHSGEEVLDELMAGHGGFRHNAQGVRIVDVLEDRNADGLGLNLTLATRSSLLKGRVPEGFPLSPDLQPGAVLPIEAQAVDHCDKIAYLCHDLDDGLRAGILRRETAEGLELWQRAQQRIGSDRRSRIISEMTSLMIHDLVQSSDARWSDPERRTEEPRVDHGKELRVHAEELLRYLRENFYRSHQVLEAMGQGRDQIDKLFARLCAAPAELPPAVQARIAAHGLERCVCDYISGMTDRYLLKLAL